MRLIGIDLGSKTGWAIQDGGMLESGTEDFSPKRFESSGMRPIRFRNWLIEVIDPTNTLIAYEEVRRHKGTDAAHCYGGLMNILLMVCEEHGIPCEGIPVGTIKQHATGKGQASKELMIASAQAKFPEQKIHDDNQADALWILDYAMHNTFRNSMTS
jgi:Holliday junction resolvasome RuvABC endonuclease subunit